MSHIMKIDILVILTDSFSQRLNSTKRPVLIQNIKNSILGEAPTRNNTSKNTGTGETKDNRNQNKRRVALELEPSAEHGESMWMLVVKVVNNTKDWYQKS